MAERKAAAPRDPALVEAARVWGVQPDYVAQGGAPVHVPDEAVLAALRELGAPVDGPGGLAGAVRARHAEQWARAVEPVVVSGAEAGGGRVPLRLLAGEATGAVQLELTREDGTTEEWSVRAEDLEGLRAVEIEGRAYVTGTVRLPEDLAHGYHDLVVRSGRRHASARVLHAPPRAWAPEGEGAQAPRDWGVFLPLYALRTARTPGVADLTDLDALQRWTAARGGAVVGTLPLLAAFLDRPYEPSPYAPVSRLFWNELYLDPARVPGLDRAPQARALLESAAYRAESERLRALPDVDYRAAWAHRRRALETLARALAPGDAPLPVELAEYVAARPEAGEYAAFRSIAAREARGWRDWPAHLRAGSVGERDYDPAAFRYHLLVQWAMDRQLGEQGHGGGGPEGARASLYMDLPLGSHPDGFDVWRRRELFADASTGAPPDALFAGGQDWGFPPLHPERARAAGHDYWVASLRHLMRVSTLLRLDHVMGLHRLFWIPRGIPAAHGLYVRYPEDELYAVLRLESHRNRTELIGEDLGTVPDEVRAGMERNRIRRMYVVPFELDEGKARLAPVPAGAAASLGTHDIPPFQALADEKGPGWTAALGKAAGGGGASAPADVLRATLTHLAAGPARLVLVSLEDLWLETASQNRPGTPGTDNWSHKARHPLEQLAAQPEVERTLTAVERGRRTKLAPPPAEAPARTKPRKSNP